MGLTKNTWEDTELELVLRGLYEVIEERDKLRTQLEQVHRQNGRLMQQIIRLTRERNELMWERDAAQVAQHEPLASMRREP